VVLCTAVGFALGWQIRSQQTVLYATVFRAVTGETDIPVRANVVFSDRMDLFPKGSGTMGLGTSQANGVHVVCYVGLKSDDPVRLSAWAYDDDSASVLRSSVVMEEISDGFYTREINEIETVKFDIPAEQESEPDSLLRREQVR
jgi:hypothetical protein